MIKKRYKFILKEDNVEDIEARVAAASNPKTPPEALAKLANDEEASVRREVADNPKTPPEVLAKLANDEEGEVRIFVALNPKTPPEVLAKLADDKSDSVRVHVAANPSTPPEVLAKLADDKSDSVRAHVAANPSTPPEALARLANDEEGEVRREVVDNPNFPRDFSKNIATQKVGRIQKDKKEELIKDIWKFFSQEVNPGDDYALWGKFSKYLNFNSQPKEIKDFLLKLNKNGKVYRTDAEDIEKQISSKEYGISYSKYSGVQTFFDDDDDDDVKVIQLNLTKELEEELKGDPEFYKFFKLVSADAAASNHPVIKNLTIAWMRYHDKFEDLGVWLIEEVQTDILYAIKRKDVLSRVFGGDVEKQKDFLNKANKFFEDWERALIVHLKHLASQKGIRHIFMSSDLIKQRIARTGKEIAKTLYVDLPKKLGFQKIPKQTLVQWKEKLDDKNNFGGVLDALHSKLADNEYLWYSKTEQIKENKVLFRVKKTARTCQRRYSLPSLPLQ